MVNMTRSNGLCLWTEDLLVACLFVCFACVLVMNTNYWWKPEEEMGCLLCSLCGI